MFLIGLFKAVQNKYVVLAFGLTHPSIYNYTSGSLVTLTDPNHHTVVFGCLKTATTVLGEDSLTRGSHLQRSLFGDGLVVKQSNDLHSNRLSSLVAILHLNPTMTENTLKYDIGMF